MATKYLQFKDGVVVEVGGLRDDREEMHASNTDRVNSTMDLVEDMLGKIIKPVGRAFQDFNEVLNTPIALDAAEVELGLSFSAEGTLFVAKSKAEGNLNVKISFKAAGHGQKKTK